MPVPRGHAFGRMSETYGRPVKTIFAGLPAMALSLVSRARNLISGRSREAAVQYLEIRRQRFPSI